MVIFNFSIPIYKYTFGFLPVSISLLSLATCITLSWPTFRGDNDYYFILYYKEVYIFC